MKIGYARVSTDEQNLDLQLQALAAAGCEEVFRDRLSGMASARPGLRAALERAGAGDTLTVWWIDRLGRSTLHLLQILDGLWPRNIGFQSIMDGIDINAVAGRMVFSMVGAIAEFERNVISERTKAGVAAARAACGPAAESVAWTDCRCPSHDRGRGKQGARRPVARRQSLDAAAAAHEGVLNKKLANW